MINHDSHTNPLKTAPYDWETEVDLPTEAEIYQFPFVNEEDDENDFPEIESDEDAEIVDITPTLAAKNVNVTHSKINEYNLHLAP